MRAVCCDRCGKFAKAGGPSEQWRGWARAEYPFGSDPLSTAPKDLCPECNQSYQEWLTQGAIKNA